MYIYICLYIYMCVCVCVCVLDLLYKCSKYSKNTQEKALKALTLP